MEFNAIYIMWLREMKRFFRAKSRIIGNLSMPFIWLVIMGIGLSSSFSIPGVKFDYLAFIAPGVIGMTLLFSSIFSGISVIWEKQFGFLKEILVAPVSRTSIVLGKIFGSATISFINGVLIMIIAILIGSISIASLSVFSILLAIIFMILICLAFVSVGIAIASRLNNMEGFQMIMSFLVMPTFFLSGAFIPLQNAPLWMGTIAMFDPLLYGVDGLRGVFLGVSQFPIAIDLGVLAGFCVAMILLSSYLFRRMGE
ncbi:MAG: ABC transporter permease [Candidatus ainarchaeum sp.]|nr:ABC transporter permease [Candidatus ainarchaeum sp.]